MSSSSALTVAGPCWNFTSFPILRLRATEAISDYQKVRLRAQPFFSIEAHETGFDDALIGAASG
jgi:hypothetical protein